MNSIVHLADCLVNMRNYPDKYFDLAIVDPPYDYSISETYNILTNKKFKNKQDGRKCGFKIGNSRNNCLNEPPPKDYFDELFRISKNQIIWGGNYFDLPKITAWIVWDKQNGENTFGDGELAWTSFRGPLRIVRTGIHRVGRIHPTQKPIKLYDWCFKKYIPEGGKVIDTHVGSGSSRISADRMGNIDFTGYEINDEYFKDEEKRYKNYKSQLCLFE